MDEITLPGGIPQVISKEAEKEALLLAQKEAEAAKYFEANFPPKTLEDKQILKELARKRAEAQVEELKRLEPEHLLEKPASSVAKEAAEKTAGVASKDVAEEALRNKAVTEDLLRKFRLRSAAEKAIESSGRIARGAAKMAGPIGNLVDLLDPKETVSEEEEMKELERLKSGQNFMALKDALKKARKPANEE